MKRESIVPVESSVTASANLNNFDLIRLFAATQVAAVHAAVHLKVDGDWTEILHIFPGVPVFFFISGFLIYQSWENIKANKVVVFATNRVLRLYPALYFCFALSVVSLFLSGYLGLSEILSPRFLTWVVTQLTVLQFYNPDFLRGYGNGVVNGSLWTICVEIQFYILTPILCMILNKSKKMFFGVAVCLALINVANSQLNERVLLAGKLFSVSFFPWVWMFMVGAYVSTDKRLKEKMVQIGWLKLLVPYLFFHFASLRFDLGVGNEINPVSFLLLACIILKTAYSMPGLASKLLRKNDISYGVYIFHMPTVNFLLYKGLTGWFFYIVALLVSFAFALSSWFLVERPALGFKKVALRKIS